MKKLTILYDGVCGFCGFCRDWLSRQPTYLELEFIPKQALEIKKRFTGLMAGGRDELVVVDDEGGVYRGDAAFLMCLYALKEYRDYAITLSDPMLKPLAQRFFKMLSVHRKGLSWILGLNTDRKLADRILADKIRRTTCSEGCGS